MEIQCPDCRQKLRVNDADRGKKARCPHCQAVFQIAPDEQSGGGTSTGAGEMGTGNDAASADADASSASRSEDGFAGIGENRPQPKPASDNPYHTNLPARDTAGVENALDTLWHLKIEDGRTFGPVPRTELNDWFAEDRITANCYVRIDSESTWRSAASIYPQLGPVHAGNANVFGDAYTPQSTAQPSPYQPAGGYLEPHRGGMVLTFGMLGMIGMCCFVFIGFSIAAWAIGTVDKRKMAEGRMDPSGQGTTSAGHVLGIIGTILGGISNFFVFVGNFA